MKKKLLGLIGLIIVLGLSGCEGNDELTLDDVKEKMSKGFDQYEENYRYDWGDNNEYHMLFDFYNNRDDNSASYYQDDTGISISYYYNQNLIRIGTCKLDFETQKPIDGTNCTEQQIKDVSGMGKLVNKILESVDLTIDDLKNAK